MRRATTLIELIFTIVIAAILTIGTSALMQSLSMSAQRAKIISNLSLNTANALNLLSSLIYNRVPNSAIGYDGVANHSNMKSLNGETRILEWLGVSYESVLNGSVTNFIDLQGSTSSNRRLLSPGSNFNTANTIMVNKFARALTTEAIVFAGSLDDGAGVRFGWHGDATGDIHAISGFTQNTLTIANPQPTYIYEKFYLVEGGYALARGANVNTNAACITELNIEPNALENSLILFYNFRPWAGETFCADVGNAGDRAGTATILAENIAGVRVRYENFAINLTLDARQAVRGSDNVVHVTKQKAIF